MYWATNSVIIKFLQKSAIGNFVKCFWKIEDCSVNCFVGLDSTRYIMNGTYELCFCWSSCPKTMVVISEHSTFWKMVHSMSVSDLFKYLCCNAGKWHGPIVWKIRFLSFLVNSTYVGMFPLDRHSPGFNTILVYIRKNLWYFLAIFFQKPRRNSIRTIRFVCLQPAKLLFNTTSCDVYCSNSQNRAFARV